MGMFDWYVRQLRHWIVSRVAFAMTAEALTIIPGTLTRRAMSVDYTNIHNMKYLLLHVQGCSTFKLI